MQTSLKSSKKKKRASVKCNKSSKKGVEVSALKHDFFKTRANKINETNLLCSVPRTWLS